jgi:U3 small nucleolar RNA-associated protein 10
MNRKILMLFRDKKKAVRIAALKTIHGLFSKVGEEYLLLLPECLPFLSESLEDDALDVAALTQEVVKYIEELSGEKLENYLRS